MQLAPLQIGTRSGQLSIRAFLSSTQETTIGVLHAACNQQRLHDFHFKACLCICAHPNLLLFETDASRAIAQAIVQ